MPMEEITMKNFRKEIEIEGTIMRTFQMLLEYQNDTNKPIDFQEFILQPTKDRRRRLKCKLMGGDVGKVLEGDVVNIKGILDFGMKKRSPYITDKNPLIIVKEITKLAKILPF